MYILRIVNEEVLNYSEVEERTFLGKIDPETIEINQFLLTEETGLV